MKVLKPLIRFAFFGLLFYSCSEGDKKSAEQAGNDTTVAPIDSSTEISAAGKKKFGWLKDSIAAGHCLDAGGLGNFIIDPLISQQMIDKFRELYGKDSYNVEIPGFKKNLWLSAATLKSLAKYLSFNPKYDGLRFYFGAEVNGDVTLCIFPTEYNNGSGTHADTWDFLKPDIPDDFLKPYGDMSKKMDRYITMYQSKKPANTTTGISLSKSVWIEACVFRYMQEIIKRYNVDGYNIKLACYLGNEPNPPASAKDLKHASTFIFIPTGIGIAKDRSDWALLKKLIAFNDLPNLNHGELCPRYCP